MGSEMCIRDSSRSRAYGAGAQHLWASRDGENVGNKVLLVAVDKASKFLFAFPLPTKEALGVARTLLEVMLTFGLPLDPQCRLYILVPSARPSLAQFSQCFV